MVVKNFPSSNLKARASILTRGSLGEGFPYYPSLLKCLPVNPSRVNVRQVTVGQRPSSYHGVSNRARKKVKLLMRKFYILETYSQLQRIICTS